MDLKPMEFARSDYSDFQIIQMTFQRIILVSLNPSLVKFLNTVSSP